MYRIPKGYSQMFWYQIRISYLCQWTCTNCLNYWLTDPVWLARSAAWDDRRTFQVPVVYVPGTCSLAARQVRTTSWSRYKTAVQLLPVASVARWTTSSSSRLMTPSRSVALSFNNDLSTSWLKIFVPLNDNDVTTITWKQEWWTSKFV